MWNDSEVDDLRGHRERAKREEQADKKSKSKVYGQKNEISNFSSVKSYRRETTVEDDDKEHFKMDTQHLMSRVERVSSDYDLEPR
jgi:hypothetical protein